MTSATDILPALNAPWREPLSVAPMMDWTDRHCRFFHRILAPRTVLYTEMVTTGALLYGDRDRFLAYNAAEHPVVLQLGGSDPAHLAKAAKMGEAAGYDAINLNVGCPSDRVQSGSFGACLMAEPDLVAACIAAMGEAVSIPVTVKTRIGIDNHDSFEFLQDFVHTVSTIGGCNTFILHARKAWLKGLSPKENRTKPPLDYGRVHRLKHTFPHLQIILNGGITDTDMLAENRALIDGFMIGRAAYETPWFLTEAEAAVFGHNDTIPASRQAALFRYIPYIEQQLAVGVPLRVLLRPLIGLMNGISGARHWRREITATTLDWRVIQPFLEAGLEAELFAVG